MWGNLMLIMVSLENRLENGFLSFMDLFSGHNVIAFTILIVHRQRLSSLLLNLTVHVHHCPLATQSALQVE
jgi:hypothetical protein